MAKKAKREMVVDFVEVDPATLTGEALKAWELYKTVYGKLMPQIKAPKEKFEQILEAQKRSEGKLPVAMELVFGYNFGKLSIGIAMKRTKKASSKAVSFDQLHAVSSVSPVKNIDALTA